MDAWGYSFRLGSARAWFEHDAEDARQWPAGLTHPALLDTIRPLTGLQPCRCPPLRRPQRRTSLRFPVFPPILPELPVKPSNAPCWPSPFPPACSPCRLQAQQHRRDRHRRRQHGQPANETADQFIARVNEECRATTPRLTAAQWLSATYINDDSEMLAAKANERYLAKLNNWIEQARKLRRPADDAGNRARRSCCCKLATAMPPPKDPAKLWPN